MENNQLNYENLHTFFKGYQSDLDDHSENNETYNKAENIRLFSENGVLSVESVRGTKLVYENPHIFKYNGYYAFKDELIVFTKTDLPVENPDIDEEDKPVLEPESFNINSPVDVISDIDFLSHINYDIQTIQVLSPVEDPDAFEQNLSCINNSNVEEGENFGLFTEKTFLPEKLCSIYDSDVPYNNTDYSDAIWSMKYDENGNVQSKLLWVGYLNIPFNAKITTIGVHESQFYKRVYFSDYTNPTRVFNIFDKKLSTRTPEEFSLNLTGTLLNPRLKEIKDSGSLNAMSVLYMYRLISENGQVSDFSATSDSIKVLKGYTDENISGGNISENVGKSVVMYCIVPDFRLYKEIELIAVEYEADLTPTAIKLIGRKNVDYYVEFEHIGNESEYSSNITLSDLFQNSISFKYNSDFSSKNNKMIVSALRNDPLQINENNIAVDFGLIGFDFNGESFDCVLNPEPDKYLYIDRLRSEAVKYVYRKLFRDIMIFETTKMKLLNTETDEYYEVIFENNSNTYLSIIDDVFNFFSEIQEDEDFQTKFPNLLIERVSEGIIFKPLDTGVYTDFYKYIIQFSSSQVILTQDNDVKLIPENELTYTWPETNSEKDNRLVYGGVSNGWFNGNGVRVTMRSYYDKVASSHTDWHDGSSPLVQINTPVQEPYYTSPVQRKGFMKGEVYRVGMQCYKDGKRLFTVILGDIKIPEIGWYNREIDEDGNLIPISTDTSNLGNGFNGRYYHNQYATSGSERSLYSCRIELQFDIRISCEMSKIIDAYQIVYVERTEDNRSILCQGITGPTERILTEGLVSEFPERVGNKWQLPVMGGPVWDFNGLSNYNTNPNNTDVSTYMDRIVTNPKLFWFDSPDIIFNKISSKNINIFNSEFLYSVAPDHSQNNILNGFNKDSHKYFGVWSFDEVGTEYEILNEGVTVPFGVRKFSQKISNKFIIGNEDSNPAFVNVSIFPFVFKSRTYRDWITTGFIDPNMFAVSEIDNFYDTNEGQILSGFQMDEIFEVSNKAITLSNNIWHFNRAVRLGWNFYGSSNSANGRRTIFIKTNKLLYHFTNTNQTPFIIRGKNDDLGLIGPNYNGWDTNSDITIPGSSAHIVINLKRDNISSLYGGRTDFAYRNNVYIPLGNVLPVIKNKIVSQIFNTEGDTYTSLFLRNKTNFNGSADVVDTTLQIDDITGIYARNYRAAWCYGVILESTVEPKFNNSEEFYKKLNEIGFSYEEEYNSAYKQENDLRVSIPVPYNFKDDPDQSNIIAISNVKLNGDYYDAWTQFKTNEFYELDKDKGAALNLYKENDEVFAIQELQTSLLQIDDRALASSESGMPINIVQGAGNSIQGHKVVSTYGTSFRRAVSGSEFGFVFFDERKVDFVKITKGLFVENNLSLKYSSFFKENKITDCEVYYDDLYKETNIRFRTETNINFLLSYNEVLKVFNGRILYDNDLYMMFDNKVLAPYSSSNKLGLLNYGNQLEFFEEEKEVLFGYVSNPEYPRTKIFKNIGMVLNTNYPIESANFVTSLGNTRTILGTHHWYKIREGVHTFPVKNEDDVTDIRGEWVDVTLRIKSINNSKIRLFSTIDYIRNSYK